MNAKKHSRTKDEKTGSNSPYNIKNNILSTYIENSSYRPFRPDKKKIKKLNNIGINTFNY